MAQSTYNPLESIGCVRLNNQKQEAKAMQRIKVRVMTGLMLLMVSSVLFAGCGRRSFELTPLQDLPEADGEGWIDLFDGKTLEGWQNARQPGKAHFWSVEEGVMANDADNGRDLSTTANFKDFELQIEYKTVPGGNSGVYLRGRVEVQILDSYRKEGLTKGDAGAVYDQYAPLFNASRPPGEWHTFAIRYVGDKLTVHLNGQKVQDNVTIREVTGGALRGRVNEPGPIMLQGDHGKVWFRNVRIRPIGL
jgi:hypothetical protein